MDPSIWGPHYWFVLHTMAFHYPLYPTSIQKKIYHRFFHNLHEFIPNRTMANTFQRLLAENPITPYLDTRADFIQWVHHMHNMVNTRLDRPTMSLADHYSEFKQNLEPRQTKFKRLWKEKQKVVYTLAIIAGVVYLYMNYRVE
jgi:hypothetical protein